MVILTVWFFCCLWEVMFAICSSVCWLGAMFGIGGIGFVWLLVSGYLLTLGMVSVLEIPWILSYKWADYWPYL